MEQSTSLTRLLEAADLLGMVEELNNPATVSKLSPSTLAGMRITIRSAREMILASHDRLASSLVSQSRARSQAEQEAQPTATAPKMGAPRDLRASLERFIDKAQS